MWKGQLETKVERPFEKTSLVLIPHWPFTLCTCCQQENLFYSSCVLCKNTTIAETKLLQKHQGTNGVNSFIHPFIRPPPHAHTHTPHWCVFPPPGFERAHHRHSWTSCTWPLSLCVHTVQSLAFEFGRCTLTSLPRTVASGSLMLPIGNNRRLTHNPEAAKEKNGFQFLWSFTVFLPKKRNLSKLYLI